MIIVDAYIEARWLSVRCGHVVLGEGPFGTTEMKLMIAPQSRGVFGESFKGHGRQVT